MRIAPQTWIWTSYLDNRSFALPQLLLQLQGKNGGHKICGWDLKNSEHVRHDTVRISGDGINSRSSNPTDDQQKYGSNEREGFCFMGLVSFLAAQHNVMHIKVSLYTLYLPTIILIFLVGRKYFSWYHRMLNFDGRNAFSETSKSAIIPVQLWIDSNTRRILHRIIQTRYWIQGLENQTNLFANVVRCLRFFIYERERVPLISAAIIVNWSSQWYFELGFCVMLSVWLRAQTSQWPSIKRRAIRGRWGHSVLG